MQNLKRFWNRMSSNYDMQAMAKYADTYKMTIDISKDHLKKSDIVLDFACGTGITTIPLARFIKEMDAIDISPNMVALAEKKANENDVQNIRFLTGTIFDRTLKQNHYDVVMAFNVLYFFEDVPEVLDRIHTLLKAGGVFLSATDCLGKRNKMIQLVLRMLCKIGILPYVNRFTEHSLRKMIENTGFEIVYEKNLYDAPANYYAVAKKPAMKS